jgi:hypothetical protein
MSLRNIKKLQNPELIQRETDDSEESEQLATPRKANNFELVRTELKNVTMFLLVVFNAASNFAAH